MKKLLPLVAVLATVVSGCWTGGRWSIPHEHVKDVKPVPVEEFTPKQAKTGPVVHPNEVTLENAKEIPARLQAELDAEK